MALQSAYTETLTKVGVNYMQDPMNFKAAKVFPACPVNLLSSQYPTYDKSYWMKNEAAIRKPGTESAGGTHERSFSSYQCEDVSYHEDVADENIKNDPNPLNPLKAATRRVTQKIAIFDEVDFTTRFLTTGVWGTDAAAPSTKWDAANSVPLEDIDGYKRAMRIATGRNGNTVVVSEQVHDVLKRHAQIKDQVKYTSAANVTESLLASILEVDRYIVMNAVFDSAAFGATAVQQYIAGNKFLLLHTTNNPSLEEPSAGYNFKWNGYGTDGYGVENIRQANARADRVEVHEYHQMKQVAADLGIFVDSPLT